MLSHFGHVRLIYDPMDCSPPCPPPRDLPDPGIEPASVISPALADRFFATSAYTLLIFLSNFSLNNDVDFFCILEAHFFFLNVENVTSFPYNFPENNILFHIC